MKKMRIDEYLVKNKYFSNVKQASAYIMAGKVFVNEQKIVKPGEVVNGEKSFDVRVKNDKKYVSRGGFKLERAIDHWQLDFEDKDVLDVGSSTGGFVDVALRAGAKKVVALDVGTNQLDYKLRVDPQVEVFEKTNFRTLPKNFFQNQFDIVTMDVSFISVRLLLENVHANLKDDGVFICLIKPQFEAEKNLLDADKGIIVDANVRDEIVAKTIKEIEKNKFIVEDMIPSPITGAKGNKEFLALIRKKGA